MWFIIYSFFEISERFLVDIVYTRLKIKMDITWVLVGIGITILISGYPFTKNRD